MQAAVAGAPVSFGVFEMTPEGAETLGPDEILDLLADADYAGVDLGPSGFLGTGAGLRRRLNSRDLELAGGWVELPLSDDEAFQASLPSLTEALHIFADAAELGPNRLPKPTIADAGSPTRRAAPGAAAKPLDARAWERLALHADVAADRVRAAGFEPTFHHHAGTFVESPDEIDRFLDRVDIDLTLDTGHLIIGGGDPVDAVRRWGTRINHLHLKDVDTTELRRVLAAGGGMNEVWSSGAFVAFGQGDIDLTAVLTAFDELDYDGWVVVEQDVLPSPSVSLVDFRVQREVDQRVNRDFLRRWC